MLRDQAGHEETVGASTSASPGPRDLHESASQVISPESCILKRHMLSGPSETSSLVVGAPRYWPIEASNSCGVQTKDCGGVEASPIPKGTGSRPGIHSEVIWRRLKMPVSWLPQLPPHPLISPRS